MCFNKTFHWVASQCNTYKNLFHANSYYFGVACMQHFLNRFSCTAHKNMFFMCDAIKAIQKMLHACNTKIIRVCMKQIFVSVATWSHSRWNFLGACNAAMLHCIRIKMLHGPNGWSFFESILNNSEFLTACATFLKSHCYVNKTTILIAVNGFLFPLTKFLF